MSRLLPRTLYGRMVLILIAGLVIAQVLSAAIFFQERERVSLRATTRYFGVRMAQIVKILDRLPASQRRAVADAVSGPDLHVSISAAAASPDASAADESSAIIASGLRRHLGAQRQYQVTISDAATGEVADAGPERLAGRKLLVQVALADRTWINFESAISETPSTPLSSRFLESMLLRLVIVVLLALVAVRLATKPLRTLADAAEELGKDIHRPPLAEHGPVEVRRAARAFNTMQARLIQYIQERTRILAAVSHDLKTPITRLRLRTELLDDAQVKAKFARDLQEMEEMVSATLNFTRGLDHAEPLRDVDLMALLESLQADAEELGHEVTVTGAVGAPVKVYAQTLKRCLGNLLDNALKYGQKADIVVDDADNQVRIAVRDDGPGIPHGELDKVFEPFYRVEASRNRATGGTGLGLSIAKNAARAHGGDLLLSNRTEGGLEATLVLPRR